MNFVPGMLFREDVGKVKNNAQNSLQALAE
jgi:hypothetical protein